MYDFECHYKEDRWQTAQYFEFVTDFLIAAQHREESDDCDPPPCPTTAYTETAEEYSKGEYLFQLDCRVYVFSRGTDKLLVCMI